MVIINSFIVPLEADFPLPIDIQFNNSFFHERLEEIQKEKEDLEDRRNALEGQLTRLNLNQCSLSKH